MDDKQKQNLIYLIEQQMKDEYLVGFYEGNQIHGALDKHAKKELNNLRNRSSITKSAIYLLIKGE